MAKPQEDEFKLFSGNQIAEWRAIQVKIERQIKMLEKKRDDLAVMIEKALSFLDTGDTPVPHRAVMRKRAQDKGPPTAPPLMKPGSRTEVVYSIVSTAKRPISYDELREELAKTHENTGNVMTGVQRLRDTGHVVLYKGHLATPTALQGFLADVQAGKAEDLEEATRHRSKWEGWVVEVLASGSDLTATEIAEELKKNPALWQAVSRSPSQVYNVLARLLKARKVEKNGSRYRLIMTKSNGTTKAEQVSEAHIQADAQKNGRLFN